MTTKQASTVGDLTIDQLVDLVREAVRQVLPENNPAAWDGNTTMAQRRTARDAGETGPTPGLRKCLKAGPDADLPSSITRSAG